MSIKKAVQENYTVGSGAYTVANPTIKTYIDEFGSFQYAVDDSSLLESVEDICCMSNAIDNELTIASDLYKGEEGIKYDPIIGYYLGLYAGYVSEGDYRLNGSSGGMANWLLVELIKQGVVDGVIHVKPSQSDSLLFEYAISKSADEIKIGAKSRYYPVEYSSIINKIKSTDESFAIVGIPSFITEIRLLQNKYPDLKEKIKFTIGLVCGHQKTTKYAECIAWQFGIKPGDLKYIDFRKKLNNAPATSYITEIVGEIEGKTVTLVKDQNEVFVSDWGHGFFKRKFSDFTDDCFNETADISLGDAWLPEYIKDSKGNNIVIIRNGFLLKLIKNAISDGRLKLDILAANKIIASQSGLVRHNYHEISYRLYKKDQQKIWRPEKRIKASGDLPYLRKKIQDTREEISTLSHSVYKKAVEIDDYDYFEKRMKPYVLKYKLLYFLVAVQDRGLSWVVRKVYEKFKKGFMK